MSSKPRIAAIALFVAAVAIAAGTLTKSWFTADRDDVGVGLAGIQACERGHCETASWGDMPRVPGEIPILGYVGLIGGVLAAAGCAAAGGMLLSNRARRIPVKPITIAIGAGAFGQLAFVNRFMSADGLHGASIGWSMIASLAGLVAAVVIVKTRVMPLVDAAAPPAPAPAPQPYTIA